MRADGRGQAWWWPAVPAVGFGLVGVSALDGGLLSRSGLASVGVAGLFALFLGGALARAEWHGKVVGPGTPAHAERWAGGLLDTAVVGSLGAALASALPEGATGIAGMCGVWAAAWLIGGARRLAGVAAALGIAWAVAAGVAVARAAPWGLLEPAFHTAPSWLGTALALGALWSWAPGHWEAAAEPAPARGNAPWLAVGVGLVIFTLGAVVHAAEWERALGGSVSPAVSALRAVSVAVAAGCVVQRGATGRDRAGWVGMGLLATFWFAWTGDLGVGFWWGATLPVLLGVACALRAISARDVLQGAAAAALFAAVFLSFPATPGVVLAGGALAVPAVAAVWIAGTRVLVGSAA